jgi:hypothetical protein
MSNRGKTLLRGHALREEGRPFTAHGTALFSGDTRFKPGEGHGLCECGAVSPILASDRQRKAWHAQHKQAVAVSDGG